MYVLAAVWTPCIAVIAVEAVPLFKDPLIAVIKALACPPVLSVAVAIVVEPDVPRPISLNAVQSAAETYITNLTTQRSLLGAYQNQIEYTVSNVTELSANLAAAKSNVVDTDYATETAALTKGQILQQAATAMLAQANQMPNIILSLLK